MGAIGDFVAKTSWLWFTLLAILLLAAAWWAFRREGTEKTNIEPKGQVRKEWEASTDDLTKLEGIGPKVAKVLKDDGITTFDDLAHANSAEVQEVLKDAGLQMMNPEGWIEQAKLAANGKWEELERLQGELKGGRRK